MEFIGWFGGILLAICGAPLAWEAWRTGNVGHSLTWTFLNLWFWGEVLVFAYVLPQWLWPLIVNYGFNILCILVIAYYKKWPRTEQGQSN